MRFREVATVRLHLATPLRTDYVVLLSVYIGRRASKIRVKDIPPEGNVTWLVVSILLCMENVVVLQTTRTPHRN